jgi:hypothetical protein
VLYVDGPLAGCAERFDRGGLCARGRISGGRLRACSSRGLASRSSIAGGRLPFGEMVLVKGRYPKQNQ